MEEEISVLQAHDKFRKSIEASKVPQEQKDRALDMMEEVLKIHAEIPLLLPDIILKQVKIATGYAQVGILLSYQPLPSFKPGGKQFKEDGEFIIPKLLKPNELPPKEEI